MWVLALDDGKRERRITCIHGESRARSSHAVGRSQTVLLDETGSHRGRRILTPNSDLGRSNVSLLLGQMIVIGACVALLA